MKLLIYGAALSAAISSRHAPKADLELRTFRKVSDAEFAVMHEEAVRLVREGLVQERATRERGTLRSAVTVHP